MSDRQTNRPKAVLIKRPGEDRNLLPWVFASLVILAFGISAWLGVQWILSPESDPKLHDGRIQFIGMCFSSAFGFFGLLFIILQVRDMVLNSRHEYDWNLRVESQRIILDNVCQKDFKELRGYRLENGKNQKDGILQTLPTAPDKKTLEHVKAVGNFLEAMAAGIKHGVYNEDILYDNKGGTVVEYYNFFKDYLIERRETRKLPKIWREFERLAIRWEIRQKADKKAEDEGESPGVLGRMLEILK